MIMIIITMIIIIIIIIIILIIIMIIIIIMGPFGERAVVARSSSRRLCPHFIVSL